MYSYQAFFCNGNGLPIDPVLFYRSDQYSLDHVSVSVCISDFQLILQALEIAKFASGMSLRLKCHISK